MKLQGNELDEVINNYCRELNVPGMALKVNQKGETIYEHYYGYRDVENKLPITKETVFGVASITKSFAALAIMQLQDEKKLSVEDPVTKWLPDFTLPKGQKADDVKIHHLLTHTAGLPGMSAVHQARLNSILADPDGKRLFNSDDILEKRKISTVEQLIEEITIADVDVIGEPGEMFNYSNESYALLQGIIERASGKPFLTYMKEKVFSPLEMNRSTFLEEELSEMSNVVTLYAYEKGKEKDFYPSPAWWNVGDIYTNGSLKSTVEDLSMYGEIFYNQGVFKDNNVLSKESIEQMMTPYVKTPNDLQYGYGFIVSERFGYRLIGHGGGIKGVSSYILIVPEEKLSITVLINIAEAPAEAIALLVFKHLFNVAEEAREIPTITLDEEELLEYVGHYRSSEGQQVIVELDEHPMLKMQLDSLEVLLNPIGDDKFVTQDGNIVAFIRKNNQIIAIFRGLRYIEKVN